MSEHDSNSPRQSGLPEGDTNRPAAGLPTDRDGSDSTPPDTASVPQSGPSAAETRYAMPTSAVGSAPSAPENPYASPAAGPAPDTPYQPPQGPYPASGQAPPAYPPAGVPGPEPIYPQAPYYGWTQAQPASAVRSGAGKIISLAVAAVVLMAGSGIVGGIVGAAFGDRPQTGPTYTAAPIIDSADLPAIADKAQQSVVSISTGTGNGSGVVLTADGYVLTNNHVVQGSNRVRVNFSDGTSAVARVIGTDPRSDLAVIKAEGVSDLVPAAFGDSDAMRVGDIVLAIGSPLGLEGSVTAGIISAKNRTILTGGGNPMQRQGRISIAGLLQTDAPINPGNSGGALVNTRGEVIGINTAIATSGQGSGNIGLGFAIPSNKAKAIADALMAGEKISHPTLGVSLVNAEGGGALVSGVVEGSPADEAGLQRGDVIIRFGDKVINDADGLVAAVQAAKVGDRVEVTYKRNGVEKTATVTLAEAS